MRAQIRRCWLALISLSLTASLLASMGVAAATQPAGADPAFRDIRRYVFVPSAIASTTTVIDADTDRIAATLQTEIVASQVEISRELAKLVATDGKSATISVLDVFEGTARRIVLPAPAQRLTLGTGGRIVAATDLAGGTITLIDLVHDRVAATVSDLPKLRDVMFGDKDAVLYVAAEGLPGVGVIDVESASLVRQIPLLHPSRGGVGSLTRMPNGRRILALPKGSGPIDVIDVEQSMAVTKLDVTPGMAGAFPSGTGTYLLVPNSERATLAVFRSDRLRDPVVLPGVAGVTGVYSAWLDSVAFMPSAQRHRVLIYDLDAPRLDGEIALPGPPTRGAVTSDSRKLYLPVIEPPQVIVLDGETRRIVATIDLPDTPLAAIVAGGWGICH